jgi:parvulin-like peptidyl-prolyl isomerase
LGGGEKVASVNGTNITKAEYDKTYGEFIKAFHLETASPQQKTALAENLKEMTLNKLILQTLIYNEAQKSGIQVTDADVASYKQKKIFNDPVMKEQFKAFLAQNKMQESDFDAMLKDNLLLNKLMDAKGGAQVQVSDAELKAFYDKNQDQFKIPERIHASHILVKAIVPQMKQEIRSKNPNIKDADLDKEISTERDALKAKADKLYTEVQANPAKFEEVAKASSDDPMSAKNGGDLGFLVSSNIDPAFWAAAEKTEKGKLYPGVVTSQFGYHIIKVFDRQEPHQQTFEEAKDMLREHLEQEKKQVFLQKWAEQQKSTAKISIEPAYQPSSATASPSGMEGAQQAPIQQPVAANPAAEGKH